MGTLKGFPDAPALWLRRAKPAYAYAIMGTLKEFALPFGSPHPARFARPRQTLRRWYAASEARRLPTRSWKPLFRRGWFREGHWDPARPSHLRSGRISSSTKHPRRGGREAEGGGLLNRYTGENLYREFESHPLRQDESRDG